MSSITRRVKFLFSSFGVVAASLFINHGVQARTICTALADARTGEVLFQQGDCSSRVTPASTFKIAISLMGFDSGFLKDEHSPTLPYQTGYVDWGGATWREPTDPSRWIKYSVVWFSQQVAQSLGQARFQRYTNQFGTATGTSQETPAKTMAPRAHGSIRRCAFRRWSKWLF